MAVKEIVNATVKLPACLPWSHREEANACYVKRVSEEVLVTGAVNYINGVRQ